VIVGAITPDGVPVVIVSVAGHSWSAIIDTGFNGDLELPATLQPFVNARFLCRNRSFLAAGQIIEEDSYLVDFPFDGQTQIAEATFVAGSEILIGTHMLREYRLVIDFPARTLRLNPVNRP
jgi:predicted aspartyl protease